MISERMIRIGLGLILWWLLAAGVVHAEPPSKYDPYLNGVVVVRSSVGEGAGFFVNGDGYLVTNHHVVGGDDTVFIGLRDGRSMKGKVLAVNEALDLALVSIPTKSPVHLTLARPNEGGVGSDVIAIGTAKGLSWSVSKGIISGLRDGADFNIGDGVSEVLLIQTDAAINPGNSGGPLILLENGHVAGVNTISFKKHIAEGISFAVSADNVRAAFSRYIEGGATPQDAGKPETGLTPEEAAKRRLAEWMTNPEAAITRLTGMQPQPADDQGGKDIILANPKKFTVKNPKSGALLVVTGRAKNRGSSPRSYIRLRGTLHDEEGQTLVTKMVYTGNYLTDAQLSALPMAEIEKHLNQKTGEKNTNVEIPPGHSVTWMVVFDRIPKEATQWAVNVVGSQ